MRLDVSLELREPGLLDVLARRFAATQIAECEDDPECVALDQCVDGCLTGDAGETEGASPPALRRARTPSLRR